MGESPAHAVQLRTRADGRLRREGRTEEPESNGAQDGPPPWVEDLGAQPAFEAWSVRATGGGGGEGHPSRGSNQMYLCLRKLVAWLRSPPTGPRRVRAEADAHRGCERSLLAWAEERQRRAGGGERRPDATFLKGKVAAARVVHVKMWRGGRATAEW